MQFKPSPLKSTLAPSFLTLSLAQWMRPLYFCWSDSSVCIRDLMTSMGVANPQATTPAKPPEISTTRKPARESEGRSLAFIRLQTCQMHQLTLPTFMLFSSDFVQLLPLWVASELTQTAWPLDFTAYSFSHTLYWLVLRQHLF